MLGSWQKALCIALIVGLTCVSARLVNKQNPHVSAPGIDTETALVYSVPIIKSRYLQQPPKWTVNTERVP